MKATFPAPHCEVLFKKTQLAIAKRAKYQYNGLAEKLFFKDIIYWRI